MAGSWVAAPPTFERAALEGKSVKECPGCGKQTSGWNEARVPFLFADCTLICPACRQGFNAVAWKDVPPGLHGILLAPAGAFLTKAIPGS